jgi:predicted RNase H-like HicB family nuclease
MRQQEDAMARQFTVVIERDDEGYLVGSVPALKGCHTQAKSMDELLERIREAIQLCLEVQGEEADDLAAFQERANDPLISFEEALKELKQRGKI